MMAKCHIDVIVIDLYDLNRFVRFLAKRLKCFALGCICLDLSGLFVHMKNYIIKILYQNIAKYKNKKYLCCIKHVDVWVYPQVFNIEKRKHLGILMNYLGNPFLPEKLLFMDKKFESQLFSFAFFSKYEEAITYLAENLADTEEWDLFSPIHKTPFILSCSWLI